MLQLKQRGFLCTPTFEHQVWAALHTRPTRGFIAAGPPGTGKTYLSQILAEVLGAQLVYYQCTPNTTEEDLLLRLMPDRRGRVVAVPGPLIRAAEASHHQPVVLMLDELDKSRPSADALLLDFLQSGRVHYAGHELQANRDHLVVIIGTNRERPLSEPLKRRLPLVEFPPLPAAVVQEHLAATVPAKSRGWVPAAVALYQQCLRLQINCSLQALQQLLEAAALLGPVADWDTLVFQFVTKDPDVHELLVQDSAGDEEAEPTPRRRRLNVEAYEPEPEPVCDQPPPAMPALLTELSPQPQTRDEYWGWLVHNDVTYDVVARAWGLATLPQTPEEIGPARVLDTGYIVFEDPVPLGLYPRFQPVLQFGQLTFYQAGVTLEQLKKLLEQEKDWKVTLCSQQVIQAQLCADAKAQLRWESTGALWVVVQEYNADATWYDPLGLCYLGR